MAHPNYNPNLGVVSEAERSAFRRYLAINKVAGNIARAKKRKLREEFISRRRKGMKPRKPKEILHEK